MRCTSLHTMSYLKELKPWCCICPGISCQFSELWTDLFQETLVAFFGCHFNWHKPQFRRGTSSLCLKAIQDKVNEETGFKPATAFRAVWMLSESSHCSKPVENIVCWVSRDEFFLCCDSAQPYMIFCPAHAEISKFWSLMHHAFIYTLYRQKLF